MRDGCLRLPARLCAEEVARMDFSRPPVLPAQLRVEAEGLKDCDSAGIAALLWLLRQAQMQDSALVWQGFSPRLQALLRLYDVDRQGLLSDARAAD